MHAYDMDRASNNERVLVFNLGATSIEVSVIDIVGGKMEIISNVVDVHFGSNHFNTRLEDHFI
jgi:molecular chaperone DnaK (HSP70)